MLVTQSCSTFCDPMDHSTPGSSVHGILQARMLEWVAMPFSRGSSWLRDWSQVSHTAGRFFTVWAIIHWHGEKNFFSLFIQHIVELPSFLNFFVSCCSSYLEYMLNMSRKDLCCHVADIVAEENKKINIKHFKLKACMVCGKLTARKKKRKVEPSTKYHPGASGE